MSSEKVANTPYAESSPDHPMRQRNFCGAAVHRCPSCGKGVAPALVRAGKHCPRCPDAEPEPSSCRNPVVAPGQRCRLHGGKAPQVVHAAAVRQVERQAGAILDRLGTPEPIGSPVEELLAQASLARQWQTALLEMVTALPDVTQTDALGVERLRAVAEAFERSLGRTAKVLADLSKLDLEGRRVRIQERQSLAVVAAINAAMKRTGIEGDLRGRLIDAVAVELRAAAEEAA